MSDSMRKKASGRGRPAILSWMVVCLSITLSTAVSAAPPQVDQRPPAEEISQPEQVAEEPSGSEAPEPEAVSAPATESQPAEAEEASDVTITVDGDSVAEESETRRHRRAVDKDTQVHVGSDLVVREDEVARDAVVFSGSLEVLGKVIGDAVGILGSVTIEGEVTGEVVAVGGSVYIGPEAEVMGDVISIGGSVEKAPGARVLGEISEIDIGPAISWPDAPWIWHLDGPDLWDVWQLGTWWSIFWTVFKWMLLVLLTSLVFLIAREPVERTSRQIRGEFWKSSLLGLVAIVFFPFLFAMVCIVLAITIIGIPLLIVIIPLVVMLLIFALLLGFTSAAYTVGRWLSVRFGWSTQSPYLALLIGVVAIQALSLFAKLLGTLGGFVWFFALMFGVTGWVVRFVAWTSGFGAAILTQLGRNEPRLPPPPLPTTPTTVAGTSDAAITRLEAPESSEAGGGEAADEPGSD